MNAAAWPSAHLPPLVNVAHQHLHHETISFQPDPAAMRLCAMYTGVGLDHLGGEEPIALVYERDTAETTGALMGWMNDNWEAEHFVGALLTTRRFIFGNLDPVVFPLEGIHTVELKGGLMSGLQLQGVDVNGQVQRKKEAFDSQQQLASFFNVLCQMHPQQRPVHPATTELASVTPQDPTGVEAALAALQTRPPTLVDPRVPLLLQLVRSALQQGMPVDAGLDMVRRIALFDRNQRCGRGQSQGFWLSPLDGDDFECIAAVEFQQCTRRFVDHQGQLHLEFRWDSSLAQAAASNAAGYAATAVFGVGWSETPTTTTATFQVRRQGPISTFQVRACSGDRFTVLPRGDDMGFLQDAHEAIATQEARALLMRAIFGGQNPLGQLLSVHHQELQHRAQQLLGHADLHAFYP